MKFVHIADVHLGARPNAGEAYTHKREREIWDTFERILNLCEKKKIELLLISGNLFHRQPLLSELKEVDYLFSKLSKTKVVFIVGNYEYLKENSYYRTFIWSDNVYPILSETLECIEIESLQLEVFGCSYHEKEVQESRLKGPVSLGNQTYHILLGYGGDAQHMPFELEDLQEVSYDYIGLGGHHKPEILVENRMACAGALEPIEEEYLGKHGYIQGEIKEGMEGNVVTLQFQEFASREYRLCQVEVNPQMTHQELKDEIYNLRWKEGLQHIFQIQLIGKRNTDNKYLLEDLDDIGNIVKMIDSTTPNYDLNMLEAENRDNLLGAYIKSFGNVEEGSLAYYALFEGVQAIEETKKKIKPPQEVEINE